jgi:hypothetical protein
MQERFVSLSSARDTVHLTLEPGMTQFVDFDDVNARMRVGDILAQQGMCVVLLDVNDSYNGLTYRFRFERAVLSCTPTTWFIFTTHPLLTYFYSTNHPAGNEIEIGLWFSASATSMDTLAGSPTRLFALIHYTS